MMLHMMVVMLMMVIRLMTIMVILAVMMVRMLVLMEEILHKLIGSLSHYLQGFIHPRWCRISSTNSSDHDCFLFSFSFRDECWY